MLKKAIVNIILLFALQLTFTACQKNYEPMVEGIWDEVMVGDIDTIKPQEWHFIENEIHIYSYRDNEEPKELHKRDSGKYILRNTIKGLYMRMAEMNDQRYNNDWEVMKLEKQRMIISVEVPGEVIYKEFTKQATN
ncbi:MAG: hypothetical protein R6U64_00495 [Bacteroidales bacterium]